MKKRKAEAADKVIKVKNMIIDLNRDKLLAFLAVCLVFSGCGKNDPKSVDLPSEAKFTPAPPTSNRPAMGAVSFNQSKLLPTGQREFQDKVRALPYIPYSVIGTREEEASSRDLKAFRGFWEITDRSPNQAGISEISNWVCVAAEGQKSLDEAVCTPFPMKGPPDGDVWGLGTITVKNISPPMPEKYYKGDILKISGPIASLKISDSALTNGVFNNYGNYYDMVVIGGAVEVIKKSETPDISIPDTLDVQKSVVSKR